MRSERDAVILNGRSVPSQGMRKKFIPGVRSKGYCKKETSKDMRFSFITLLLYPNMLPSCSCTYLFYDVYQISWPHITRLWIGSFWERHRNVFFSLTLKHVTSNRLHWHVPSVTYNLLTKVVTANDMGLLCSWYIFKIQL
jgi:hypothetical protein